MSHSGPSSTFLLVRHAGLLLVRVCGAGYETKPFDCGLSEQEQSLLPRILTKLLEHVDLVLAVHQFDLS